MTTKKPSRPVKFVFTRIAIFSLTVGAFVWLWAGVAWANRPSDAEASEGASDGAAQWSADAAGGEEEPLIVDGWRWDEGLQDWVLVEDAASTDASDWSEPVAAAAAPAQAAPAAAPVIIVERQPIHYVTKYVYETPVPAPIQTSGAPPIAGSSASPAQDSNKPVLPRSTPVPQAVETRPQPAPTRAQPQPAAPVPTARPQPAPTKALPPTPVPPTPVPPTPAPPPAPPKRQPPPPPAPTQSRAS